MKWTPELDARLLLTVITVLSPSPPDWDRVAQLMGCETTAESVRQHYQKLRKTAGKDLEAGTSRPTPETVTPQKRTKKTGDSKDPNDADESPSKKMKKEKKEVKQEVKQETEQETEVV